MKLFKNKIISTNDYAWHGNPLQINCKNGEKRIFLTLSYVSEQYVDLNKKEKAFFVKRPEDEENDKSTDKKASSNNNFTISQSAGYDGTVDSNALESYNYIEPIEK